MQAIRITSEPKSEWPLDVRLQWVGIVIPLATPGEISSGPPVNLSEPKENYHLVLTDKAIQALKDAGREKAVKFWATRRTGRYMQIPAEICVLEELTEA